MSNWASKPIVIIAKYELSVESFSSVEGISSAAESDLSGVFCRDMLWLLEIGKRLYHRGRKSSPISKMDSLPLLFHRASSMSIQNSKGDLVG